jgi:hypothetical protein
MPTKKNATMPVHIETGPKVTRVHCPGMDLLNTYELQAIRNLFAWVAAEQDTAEETVQSITAAHFGANDVKSLPRKDYDEVIRFLVGLRIDEMRH